MTPSPTRRAALGLVASAVAGAALPLVAQSPAAAQAGPTSFGATAALPAGLRFREVAVDASRLARLGNVAGTERVTRLLTRHLREIFADLMAPRGSGGATLVARISSIYLTSYAGSRSFSGRDGGGNNDNMEGVGFVSAGGRVLAQVPILSVLDAGYSGAWYQPDIDEKRVDSICYHFAWWLRREMGV